MYWTEYLSRDGGDQACIVIRTLRHIKCIAYQRIKGCMFVLPGNHHV